MLQFPPHEGRPGNKQETIKTYVADALHFQRCIQNVRVRDTEIEIPVFDSVLLPALLIC